MVQLFQYLNDGRRFVQFLLTRFGSVATAYFATFATVEVGSRTTGHGTEVRSTVRIRHSPSDGIDEFVGGVQGGKSS